MVVILTLLLINAINALRRLQLLQDSPVLHVQIILMLFIISLHILANFAQQDRVTIFKMLDVNVLINFLIIQDYHVFNVILITNGGILHKDNVIPAL